MGFADIDNKASGRKANGNGLDRDGLTDEQRTRLLAVTDGARADRMRRAMVKENEAKSAAVDAKAGSTATRPPLPPAAIAAAPPAATPVVSTGQASRSAVASDVKVSVAAPVVNITTTLPVESRLWRALVVCASFAQAAVIGAALWALLGSWIVEAVRAKTAPRPVMTALWHPTTDAVECYGIRWCRIPPNGVVS
jgi:hypothetical protein